ncbi:RES family NAD+ phosphorylase [Paenibacillus chondroitinus]|uniref:RES family NAD+ phosphorylase n=1 Tax=Paenibacillus chondroitinus TaxID=59842 RepID=A0ABU6DJ53_9BACL|nr:MULTISPECIES: RES family NAD+ phosphorylase [Paenibacillus]MCY9659617.1 RES family NAD+ phosphorylase [Paenibacillus anseongense]MEB4797013.1 RES family NAD+ phosphorylase [Paenibacillus chondroitinus]
MSVCCVKCFQDNFIRNKIFGYKTRGDCSYCGNKSQSVIPVYELTSDFEVFFNIYDRSQKGGHWESYIPSNAIFGIDDVEDIIFSDLKPLHQHIQNDWSVFSGILPEGIRIQLLSDIYSFSKITTDWNLGVKCSSVTTIECARFYDNIITDDDKRSLWGIFCKEIKTQNRFILRSTPIKEIIDLLDTKRVKLNVGEHFFRARVGFDVDNNKNPISYPKEKLGMAPAKLVSDGRANPRGISYLYTASDIDTAISEVRPWKSALVSVATFKLNKELEIVDLTLSEIESPFQTVDLRDAIQLQQLLEAISMEFSKPVGPSDSGIDYLPTQYIAELIKSNRFAGFKFKSSIANGNNYVFFGNEALEIIETSLHRVNEIQISQSPV